MAAVRRRVGSPTGVSRRETARRLRSRQTETEVLFWELVRDRRLDGLKFRRQHPLGPFVADFYCAELRLADELDGAVHDELEAADRWRDATFQGQRITVLRIPNDELFADPDAVAQRVRDAVAAIREAEHGDPRIRGWSRFT
jgi:very-short-patch-repair endonuclease